MVKNRQFWSAFAASTFALRATADRSPLRRDRSYYLAVMRLLTPAVFVVALIANVAAQRPTVPPQEALALTNASVVNVRTGAVSRNATVVLRGGRIESVTSGPAPPGVRSI